MKIRTATLSDLDAITAVEAACFPAQEAASRESLQARLSVYPNHFWLLEHEGNVVALINGMVTNQATITDDLFDNAALHDEQGAWQTIFGVDTLPSHRRRGLGAMLMRHVIAQAQHQGRQGCILTCKQGLIPYYEQFGYHNEGISQSVHGGTVWYDMRLGFEARAAQTHF